MRLHVFFSVLERLFGPIVETLRKDGLESVSGFVWGEDQRAYLDSEKIAVSPLTVFTTDIVDRLDDQPADLEYLAAWELRCGVSLAHMMFAERHLLQRYSYEKVLRIAELTFRRVELDFDTNRPDVYFSEDVACLVSYIHWAVAKARAVRIVFLNNSRFPRRVTTYGNPFQQYDRLDEIFPDTPTGALDDADLHHAEEYIQAFRARPTKLPGLIFRSRLGFGSQFDLKRLSAVFQRWGKDSRNPTLRSPSELVFQRGRRLLRSYISEKRALFERPVAGEKYVLYPLHFQPEATTLVLAPYFLNQLALIEDIAKSLPAGFRLYVKEHVISRGRWPISFYEAIRRVPGVRLLSPSEDSITLIRNSAAVAVITGTMGWEGLLLEKPVITFGRVFYNRHPHVIRAAEYPKQDWPRLVRAAVTDYRNDPALLRRFVACTYRTTFPGITGNPSSFPEILEPANVAELIRVVGSQIGLTAPLRGGRMAS